MDRLGRWVSLLAGAVAVPLAASAQERGWNAWGGHPMWGVWSLWGVGMMLGMLLFWALLIAGLVLGLRWLLTERQPPGVDRALAVLRERYARGEISKEEFEAKRRDLDAA